MTQRNTLKLKRRTKKTVRRFRVPCVGNSCDVMVLRDQGECRKCKRLRLRAGLKRIKKAERANG